MCLAVAGVTDNAAGKQLVNLGIGSAMKSTGLPGG